MKVLPQCSKRAGDSEYAETTEQEATTLAPTDTVPAKENVTTSAEAIAAAATGKSSAEDTGTHCLPGSSHAVNRPHPSYYLLPAAGKQRCSMEPECDTKTIEGYLNGLRDMQNTGPMKMRQEESSIRLHQRYQQASLLMESLTRNTKRTIRTSMQARLRFIADHISIMPATHLKDHLEELITVANALEVHST